MNTLAPQALSLTARQLDLLKFIERHNSKHGFAPSYDEMAENLGLKSKSGISRLVNGLVKRGWLVCGYGQARSVSITRTIPGEKPCCPNCGEALP